MLERILTGCVVVVILGTPLLYRTIRDRDYRNVREVEAGVLYRSGQMTPEGFARIVRELQIGTVISLRDPQGSGSEFLEQFEEEYCQQHGLTFYRLTPKSWSTPDGQRPATENVDRFLAIMNDPNTRRPVLIHCFAGIHRTGAHVAAYRMERHGWTPQQALAELQSIGTSRTTYAEDLLDFVREYRCQR